MQRERQNARRRELRAEARKVAERAARKKIAIAKKRAALRRAEKRLKTKVAAVEIARQKRRTVKGDKREVEREIKRLKKKVSTETTKAFEKTVPKPTTAPLREMTEAERQALATDKMRRFFAKTIARAKKRLPKPRRGYHKVVFDNGTRGYEADAKVEMTVDERGIEEIYYQIDQASMRLPGKLPLWLATLFFSAMGEEIVGSPKLLDLKQVLNQSYQTIGVDNSGVWKTRAGMMSAVRQVLEGLLSPRYRNTVIHCLQAVVRNYKMAGSAKP
jgi:hypothetical protein